MPHSPRSRTSMAGPSRTFRRACQSLPLRMKGRTVLISVFPVQTLLDACENESVGICTWAVNPEWHISSVSRLGQPSIVSTLRHQLLYCGMSYRKKVPMHCYSTAET